ncbi:hypothetical protein GXY_14377 [Novacetimonas hansenii ATCC 23769]|uniref:Uncharacterized protein n=1 Tax=Novacetimonas hansenii ATCC 23769 TaxID=714995 RepID=D5QI94_NOVHA|nr:hypothetical protein GXY_14377 [Novacetimonas hansenii ATCC 23769]
MPSFSNAEGRRPDIFVPWLSLCLSLRLSLCLSLCLRARHAARGIVCDIFPPARIQTPRRRACPVACRHARAYPCAP